LKARAAVAICAVILPGSPAAAGTELTAEVPEAARYATGRQGVIRFAYIDEDGRLRGRGVGGTSPAASVFKVMLMATYLRQPSVRHRELREHDRDLLAPMIRWSDNAAATLVRNLVGAAAINRLARAADMRDFQLLDPWGLSLTSPRDQARFMFELERYIPARHRDYARRLLASIVPSQRWGIPKAAPREWTVFFKGGWGSGTGKVCHQVAFLESGERRIAVAIFTESSPGHRYATRTVRGVASRLLR
jgi:beta-lactamase class A